MDSFPDPIITLIVVAPTYKYLVEIFRNINGNAASIQTNLGGGLGCLALMVSTAAYAILSANTLKSPINTRDTHVSRWN